MFISEIFYSIQGEGNLAGTPAIFVRTGKCNLQCTWCDTKYTWHPDFSDYSEWPIKKVVQEAENLAKRNVCRHLVITGGEPMLQQEDVMKIRRDFPDFFIEMETNGSVPNRMGEGVIDQFNISPKLSNSGNRAYQLRLRADNAIYKFVIDQPSDLEEIESYVAAACRRHGKRLGVGGLNSRPELAKEMIALGASYVSAGSDTGFLMSAATATAKTFR